MTKLSTWPPLKEDYVFSFPRVGKQTFTNQYGEEVCCGEPERPTRWLAINGRSTSTQVGLRSNDEDTGSLTQLLRDTRQEAAYLMLVQGAQQDNASQGTNPPW